MSHLELGNVAEWLAGLALPLAFVQLGRQAQDRRRDQVVKVGAWCDPVESAEGHGPLEFGSAVHVRNASDLPVTVSEVEVTWRPFWYLPATGVDGEMYMQKHAAGRERLWLHAGVLGPQAGWDAPLRYPQTDPWATRLVIPPDAEYPFLLVAVTRLVVIDNSGRRWQMRPLESGRPRQMHELPAWTRPVMRRLSRRRGIQIEPTPGPSSDASQAS